MSLSSSIGYNKLPNKPLIPAFAEEVKDPMDLPLSPELLNPVLSMFQPNSLALPAFLASPTPFFSSSASSISPVKPSGFTVAETSVPVLSVDPSGSPIQTLLDIPQGYEPLCWFNGIPYGLRPTTPFYESTHQATEEKRLENLELLQQLDNATTGYGIHEFIKENRQITKEAKAAANKEKVRLEQEAAIQAKLARIEADKIRKLEAAERKMAKEQAEIARRAAQSSRDKALIKINTVPQIEVPQIEVHQSEASQIEASQIEAPQINAADEIKKQNRRLDHENKLRAAERKRLTAERRAAETLANGQIIDNYKRRIAERQAAEASVTNKFTEQIKNLPQFLQMLETMSDDEMKSLLPSFTNVSTKSELKSLSNINLNNPTPMEVATFILSVEKEIKYKYGNTCDNTLYTNVWDALNNYHRVLECIDHTEYKKVSFELCNALKPFKPQANLSIPDIMKRLINNRISWCMLNKDNSEQFALHDATFNSILGSIKLSESEHSFIMAIAHKCAAIHRKMNSDPFKTANTMLAKIINERTRLTKIQNDISILEGEIESIKKEIDAFETPLLNDAHTNLLQYISKILKCYYSKYSSQLEDFESTGVFPTKIAEIATKYSFWSARLNNLRVKEYSFGASITDIRTYKEPIKPVAQKNNLPLCTSDSPCPESERQNVKYYIINFIMNLHEEKLRKDSCEIYNYMMLSEHSFSESIEEYTQAISDELYLDMYEKEDYQIQLDLYNELENIHTRMYIDSHLTVLKNMEAKKEKLVELKGSISYATISREFKVSGKKTLEQEMINHAVKTAQALNPNGQTVDFLAKLCILLNTAQNDAELAIKYEQSHIYKELCETFAQRGNDQAVAFAKGLNNKVIACRKGRNCQFIREISKVLRENNVANFTDLPLVKRVALQNMCMFYHVGIDANMNINPEFAHNYRLQSILKSDDASDLKEFLPTIWEILCEKMIEQANLVQEIYRKIQLGNSIEKGSGKQMDYPNIRVDNAELEMIDLLLQQHSLTADKMPVLIFSNQNFKTLLQMYYGVIYCGGEQSSHFNVEYKGISMTKCLMAFAYSTKNCKCAKYNEATSYRDYTNQLIMSDLLSPNPKIANKPNLLNLCLSGCSSTNNGCSGLGLQCMHGSHSETFLIDIPSGETDETMEEDPIIAEAKLKIALENGTTPQQLLDSHIAMRDSNKQEYFSLTKSLYELICEIVEKTGHDIPLNITNFKSAIGRANSRIGNILAHIKANNTNIKALESKLKDKESTNLRKSELKKLLSSCLDEEEYTSIQLEIKKIEEKNQISMSEYNHVADLRSEITSLQIKLVHEISQINLDSEAQSAIETISEAQEVKIMLKKALDLVSERNKIDKQLEDSYRTYIQLYKKVHNKYPSQYGLSELCNIQDDLNVKNMCYLTKRYETYQNILRESIQTTFESECIHDTTPNPNSNWREKVQTISQEQLAKLRHEATCKQSELIELERAERSNEVRRIRAEKLARERAENQRRMELEKRAIIAVENGEFPDVASFYANNARKEEEARLQKIAMKKAADQTKRETEEKHRQAEYEKRQAALRVQAIEKDRNAELAAIARIEAALVEQRERELAEQKAAAKLELDADDNNKTGFYSKAHTKRLQRIAEKKKAKENVEETEVKSVKISNQSERSIKSTYDLLLEFNKTIGMSIPAFMKKIRDAGFKTVSLPKYISELPVPSNYFEQVVEHRKLQVINLELANDLDTLYGTGDMAQSGSKYVDLFNTFAGEIETINSRLADFGSIRIKSNPTLKDLRRFYDKMCTGDDFITENTIEFMHVQESMFRLIEAISSECDTFNKHIRQIKTTIQDNETKMHHFKINARNKLHDDFVKACAKIVSMNQVVDQQVNDMITCIQALYSQELQIILENLKKTTYEKGTLSILCKLFKDTESMSLDVFYSKWMETITGIVTIKQDIVEETIEPVVSDKPRFIITKDDDKSLKSSGYYHLDLGFKTDADAKAFVKESKLQSKFGCPITVKDTKLVAAVYVWSTSKDKQLQDALIKTGLMTETERNTPVYNGMNA